MGWEDQGRQEHGWFGHGTAPEKPKDAADDSIFGPNGVTQRIEAVAHGAVGALPHALRARVAAQYDAGNLTRLTQAMTAWSQGAKLSAAEFADRFFGRTADDPAAGKLRSATLDVTLADSHADLREAADNIADAMQAIGVDNWPRFLADAQARADGSATIRHDDVAPVPFVDDKGQVLLDSKNKPMMRPAEMDPHFFINQALRDMKVETGDLLSLPKEDGSRRKKDGLSALAYQVAALSNFGRGGPWDAQRIGGSFHAEFVDYATVAIGLYCAANGITREQSLMIQNFIARTSHYRPNEEMDNTYTHLPTRNVYNTDLGYALYQSGRIAATPEH